MSKTVSFSISSQDGKTRNGKLVVSSESANKHIETPCCILGSRLGAPPNFTLDIWNDFKRISNAVQIGVADIYNDLEAMVGYGKGIHGFIGCTEQHNNALFHTKQENNAKIGETLIYTSIRDPLNSNSPATSMDNAGISNDSVTLLTRGGRSKITVQQFISMQQKLNVDIVESVSMDVPFYVNTKKVRKSVEVSLAWLDKCLESNMTNVFGVVQGGNNIVSRKTSAIETAKRTKVAGFVLGGFGLGENQEQRNLMITTVINELPADKARVLPGLGAPNEVLEAIELGCDIFSTNYPHLHTEWGQALTFSYSPIVEGSSSAAAVSPYKINLRSKEFQLNTSPLLVGCECYACKSHTCAYIHHLLNTHEMLANVLLSIHNTWHYLGFFQAIRESIANGRFGQLKNHIFTQYYPNVPLTAAPHTPEEHEAKRVKT